MLSPAIEPHLPETVNPADCTALLTLKSALGGSYGETHFVGHEASVLVLSRSGSFGEFDLVTLPADRLPSVYKKSWRNLLSIQTDDGAVHELELSDDERRKAMVMLEGLYRDNEAWPQLATLMSERLDDMAGNQRLDALMQLGDIYLAQLELPDKAYECFSEVHDNYSHRDNAIAGMERIVDRGHLAETIAPMLEERYRRGHNPQKLSWLLAIKAPTLTNPSERAAAFLEAGRLTRQLEQLEDALALVGRALVEDPGDADVIRVFDEMVVETSSWETALNVCEAALNDELHDEVRSALLTRITRFCSTQLQLWERAETGARALLAMDDQAAEWWLVLDTTYQAQERWSDLAEVIERRAELATPADRAGLLYRLAELFAEELADTDSSAATLYRVLEIDATHNDSFVNLEAIHRARNELPQLRELLTRWLRLQPGPAERIDTSMRLAKVCEQLEDLPAAIDAWARILVDKKDHQDALTNMVRLYRTMAKWSDVVSTLLRFARDTETNQLATFSEAAETARTQLDDSSQALDIYLEAHATCRVDRTVLDAISSLATQLGRDNELIRVLRELVAMDSVSMDDALAYRMALAEALERTHATDESIQIWQNILAAHPDNARAMASLYKQYTALERWAELAEIVSHTLKLTEGIELRVNILLELAGIYADKMGTLEPATDCYAAVLEIAPDHQDAIELMIANLTARHEWSRLVALYRRRGMPLDTARVLERKLDDPAGALDVLLEVLDKDFRNQKITHDVARLSKAVGKETYVLSRLEKRLDALTAAHAPTMHETIDMVIGDFDMTAENDVLRMALGDHYYRVRRDYAEAARRYSSVGGSLHTEAMRRLRDTFRDAQDWQALATQLKRMGAAEELSKSERRDVYRELADVYATKLDQQARAKEALRKSKSNTPLVVIGIALLAAAGIAAYVFVLRPIL